MKIEVETQRIRKTPTKQRGTYTYVTAEGCKIVLHPGEKAPRNWNLSLDTSLSDEDDSATLGDMELHRRKRTARRWNICVRSLLR